jgi:hypothetical protein
VTVPPAQQAQITISLKRTRWLVVFTTAYIALLAALLVLDWRVEPGDYPLWLLQLLLLVVLSYRVVTWGYEIVIRGDKVRIRSLLRSWEFSLLAADGVALCWGMRRWIRWMWVVYYVNEGQRRNIVVITRQDLRMTPLAKAPPEHQ